MADKSKRQRTLGASHSIEIPVAGKSERQKTLVTSHLTKTPETSQSSERQMTLGASHLTKTLVADKSERQPTLGVEHTQYGSIMDFWNCLLAYEETDGYVWLGRRACQTWYSL